MDARNLATDYDLPLIDWDAVAARLDQGFSQAPGTGGPDRHSCWLTTTDEDGGPHVTGVGMWWQDGEFWFQAGLGTRKARNLARDPRCAVALALNEYDVVVEGTAQVVTDRGEVARFAEQAAADGWPCRVDDSGEALTAEFSAPSAGPPPWHVHRITPVSATVLKTVGDGGATRWTF